MQVSELTYFKDILENRKLQILKNIDGGHSELEELSRCELNDEGDYASVTSSSVVESSLVLKQQQELYEINFALSKVKSGSYGKCDMCDDPIGFQRLKVKPHALYCINCREVVEKQK